MMGTKLLYLVWLEWMDHTERISAHLNNTKARDNDVTEPIIPSSEFQISKCCHTTWWLCMMLRKEQLKKSGSLRSI